MSLKKLAPDDYRVGWICPLEVEQTAAMEMLDEEHQPLKQSPTDHNVYKLGSIHGHNVVIAGLPQTGNCSTATVVTQMRMTFKKLRYGLLVGIGGGVPVETDNGIIRLGHVVVSKPTGEHSGAIQYDHGKAIDGFIERTGSLMPPPAAFLNAAQALAVEQSRAENDPIWENTQRIRSQRRGLRHFKFPGIANDHLYQPDYNHQQMGMTCEKGGCNPEQRIERPVEEDDECFIVVHRGTIASGELVIKDAKKRDFLAQKYNLLCFETEAAGALADFPCLVIRGISDYCDSHKNNNWHGFAAAAAAAYARRLFFHMPTEIEEETAIKPTAFDLQSYLPGIRQISKFVARKEELTEMQEALQPTVRPHRRRAVVLHGLGGIGKTQLALEYAQRHHEHYSTRIWLEARNETTINQSFTRLAERILEKEQVTYIQTAVDSQDQSIILKAVKRWLDEPANKSWLIIYDNYDYHDLDNAHTEDKEFLGISSQITVSMNLRGQEKEVRSQSYDIRKYFPEADHGTIIITSRVSSRKLGRPIEISKLRSLDDCLEILASNSGRNMIDDPAAVDLARRLDGLPLALASAGAYLRQVPVNCTEYLQDYEKSWVELHKNTKDLESYDKVLCTTWDITHKHIQEQNSTASLLLRQWAYFDSKDLWYELLQNGRSHKLDWLRDLTKDRIPFRTTMRLICDHGLAQAGTPITSQEEETAGYSVHVCVHSWMINVLNRESDKDMARAALDCVGSHVPSREQPKFWSKQQRLLGHADRCYELISTILVEDENPRPLHCLGFLYADQNRLSKAEILLKQAIQGFEKTLGPKHKSTLNATNTLGNALRNQGRLNEAEAKYKQILQERELTLGPEHISTLETVSNLGVVYKEQGRLNDAEALLERALQGFEKLDSGHKSIFNILNNLGLVYRAQGQLDKAEAICIRVLQGQENKLGPEHISTLDAVNNLGLVYLEHHQLDKAEAMFKRALEGKEKAWGLDHTSTLETVLNLGLVYKNQFQVDKAEALFNQAIQGFKKVLGPEHTSTLSATHGLGMFYMTLSRFTEAEALLKEALQGFKKVSGPEHTLTLEIAKRLGDIYVIQHRFDEAEATLQQALRGFKKALGPEHTSTLMTVQSLGSLYKRLDRFSEAEDMCKQALQGYEKALGPTHPSTLLAAYSLGDFYITQGKLSEALDTLERALQRSQALGPENILTCGIISSLGQLYTYQDRLSEAEDMFERAIQGSKALGPEHILTLGLANYMGQIYTKRGRLDEAEAMHKRAFQGLEKAFGPESIQVFETLNDLGRLYTKQDRPGEAEAMFKKALQGFEKASGPEKTSTLVIVNNMGHLYTKQGRFGEAEAMHERALQGFEKALGPDAIGTHIHTLDCLEWFGDVFYKQGKSQNARQYYIRAEQGLRAVLGADHERVRRLSEVLEEIGH
ncbi:tetratricopeptide repeat domain-containing protein [Trichoderma breve]|uniref:Tetratricopeptide repeat domain-containing protein n=1 Tax=Trichoderma breve TaxID=2034170 RepID=A0A9W9B7T2_9HYPO|nr:tetratricopeptide repeat domain-containing protein [Trichoderma breve]KAJ4855360.1 tetratricopeptide repeat domain-containing protein [Trichoderma breve]